MKYMRMVLVLTLLLMTSVSAFAGNKYSDQYTTEDSAGHWTFTSMESGKILETTSVISATPATLTTASSGTTYIVDNVNTAIAADATIVTIVLPEAADQLMYKFCTGDLSVIVLEVADSNFTALYTDTIMYGTTPATNTSLRLTGATGATIEIHGDSDGLWYVSDMVGTWSQETKS